MNSTLHLFEGYGIELEYMLVDVETLAVSPVCDRVLQAQAGMPTCELETGRIGWSNELAAHVIELKTAGPASAVDDSLAEAFCADLRRVDTLAREFGARVLPTAMHPLMDPARESVLWPHEGRDIYRTYDAVFGCEGHGWTNLQSCHLNLPFCGAEEFGALHAAIRAVLGLLPALAASSPFVQGQHDGTLDRRLAVYMQNQRRVPSVIGHVVPEPVYTPEAYVREILEPMYADIAPLDPEGELQYEWLNSRGAIARFDRNAIEIRVLDVQETPWVDLAVVRLVAAVVQALVEERWVSQERLRALPTAGLREVFDATTVAAEGAWIRMPELLVALGQSGDAMRADQLWRRLCEDCLPRSSTSTRLDKLLDDRLRRGSLARRILARVGPRPTPDALREVYGRLAQCALDGRLF